MKIIYLFLDSVILSSILLQKSSEFNKMDDKTNGNNISFKYFDSFTELVNKFEEIGFKDIKNRRIYISRIKGIYDYYGNNEYNINNNIFNIVECRYKRYYKFFFCYQTSQKNLKIFNSNIFENFRAELGVTKDDFMKELNLREKIIEEFLNKYFENYTVPRECYLPYNNLVISALEGLGILYLKLLCRYPYVRGKSFFIKDFLAYSTFFLHSTCIVYEEAEKSESIMKIFKIFIVKNFKLFCVYREIWKKSYEFLAFRLNSRKPYRNMLKSFSSYEKFRLYGEAIKMAKDLREFDTRVNILYNFIFRLNQNLKFTENFKILKKEENYNYEKKNNLLQKFDSESLLNFFLYSNDKDEPGTKFPAYFLNGLIIASNEKNDHNAASNDRELKKLLSLAPWDKRKVQFEYSQPFKKVKNDIEKSEEFVTQATSNGVSHLHDKGSLSVNSYGHTKNDDQKSEEFVTQATSSGVSLFHDENWSLINPYGHQNLTIFDLKKSFEKIKPYLIILATRQSEYEEPLDLSIKKK